MDMVHSGKFAQKALANTAKHVAFNQCAERNLCGMVDAEIRILEADLFAGKVFWA